MDDELLRAFGADLGETFAERKSATPAPSVEHTEPGASGTPVSNEDEAMQSHPSKALKGEA